VPGAARRAGRPGPAGRLVGVRRADAEAERHPSRVRDVFGDHELALVARSDGSGDGQELVALGWAVPLRWSGAVADLPGGYTDSLKRALADLDAGAATDTLVVCAVQVRSDLGGRGLAGRLRRAGHRPAAPDGQARLPAWSSTGLTIENGTRADPHATVSADSTVWAQTVFGGLGLANAERDHDLIITGDRKAVRRLITAFARDPSA
jgi:hypothetical protein